jgi:hypothetical protein
MHYTSTHRSSSTYQSNRFYLIPKNTYIYYRERKLNPSNTWHGWREYTLSKQEGTWPQGMKLSSCTPWSISKADRRTCMAKGNRRSDRSHIWLLRQNTACLSRPRQPNRKRRWAPMLASPFKIWDLAWRRTYAGNGCRWAEEGTIVSVATAGGRSTDNDKLSCCQFDDDSSIPYIKLLATIKIFTDLLHSLLHQWQFK